MKNKKLFKNLTSGALILTSAMAFSSSAFAKAAKFELNTDGTLTTTIKNTRNSVIALTFKKTFAGGGYSNWDTRSEADGLDDFTNADEFSSLYKVTRAVGDSSAEILTMDNGKKDNELLGTTNYKVTVESAVDHDDTTGDDTITYTITLDREDANGKDYTFYIEEYTDATDKYISPNKAATKQMTP